MAEAMDRGYMRGWEEVCWGIAAFQVAVSTTQTSGTSEGGTSCLRGRYSSLENSNTPGSHRSTADAARSASSGAALCRVLHIIASTAREVGNKLRKEGVAARKLDHWDGRH